jgi:dipeptidyl aminopeptidase/acylaminoacyl peptidase
LPFEVPDSDVVSIVDAPPTPLAFPAPGDRYLVLLNYEAHPPIEMLAKPVLKLGGLRIDPVLGGRQRTRRFTGLTVLDVAEGIQYPLALPEDARVSLPVWAPDGHRFAFCVDEPDGVGLWSADAAAVSAGATAARVPGVRVKDVLGGEPPNPGGAVTWSRDGRSLLVLGAMPRAASRAGPEQIEPRVEEAVGKKSIMATYQDMLKTPADEDKFEELASAVPLRVDPVTGAAQQLGPPGLYQYLEDSPDGQFLLVYQIKRPFSYRVPYGLFARGVDVWPAGGLTGAGPVAVIADLPVSDEVPRMGVPTGPRLVTWDERAPARLLWTQALDGGDPMAPAEHRDQVMTWSAPFAEDPQIAFKVRHRCLGWNSMDDPGMIMLTEYDRDRRWTTTWLCDLGQPDRNRVLFDLSEDDAYADPGDPVLLVHADGSRTVRQEGRFIYLCGAGATPEGERPFLDRYDLDTAVATRLFRSRADAHETVLCFAADRIDQVVVWHQSPADPPNLHVVALAGAGGHDAGPARRQLTHWPDPHPMLTGMEKRLMVTDRGDGVRLSGMLHLPPGYRAERDGPLPLVIWAYPYDFGSAGTAGQVRLSSNRFTRLNWGDAVWFVLRGYAVLNSATMPVIGDPETKNDTYIEQITAAAIAHIKALTELGVADPARVAVAGHSYGAFMTANLLAHTDLFAAGIARSGAYNRTLTPFGFQTERRNYWEVPQVYDQVSPFRYADRIKSPILLIHGAEDSNSGTYPVQSERLFQAIAGTGGTARLVMLPFESHSYIARESVLHVLAEQFRWLGRWMGERPGHVAGSADGQPG